METTTLENLLTGATGFIAAVTALVIGSVELGKAIRPLIRYSVAKWKDKQDDGRDRLLKPLTLTVGLAFVLLSATLFQAPRLFAQAKPTNVRLTSEAWNAFNAKNWALAVSKADECIKEFLGHADEQQAELEKAKAPQPPEGEVSETEKKQIFKLGLINDVATCFWIKGRAAQELGKKEEAKQAFQAAAKYTYARCWDPNGWFWNPAKDARIRLKQL